jgi:prepilin-type N-terminal cleavage/methylation domain-containing protein
MRKGRSAFTLIEVLVSVLLLSMVLAGLYESLEIQRSSNRQLHTLLQKSLEEEKVLTTLYQDLLSSNGMTGVITGEFDRLCIPRTSNSLYGLSTAKVCWVVSKPGNDLLRVEGGDFRLPLRPDDRVEIDRVLRGVTLFDIYRSRGNVLILLQTKQGKPYAFMVRGITPASPKEPRSKPKRRVPPPAQQDTNGTEA